jgi:hypothetical protein
LLCFTARGANDTGRGDLAETATHRVADILLEPKALAIEIWMEAFRLILRGDIAYTYYGAVRLFGDAFYNHADTVARTRTPVA